VASLLAATGADHEVVAAGVLHDTLEKTPAELASSRGGSAIASPDSCWR
jgi:(p)ppGpp synthase/HD superfamily hydrolase